MSATKWWRSELEIQAAANGFASTGEWYMTATPSSSPDELFYGKKCLFISSRNHDFPDCDSLELVARVRPFRLMTLLVLRKCCVAPTEGCVSGLCSGFCTNSFCCSLMLIRRPRRTVFLRAVQTATSFSSNLSSAYISTLIGVLKELPRIPPSSTPVGFFFSCVFERLNICICTVGFVLRKIIEPFGDHFIYLLNSYSRFLHAAVRISSQ